MFGKALFFRKEVAFGLGSITVMRLECNADLSL